MEKRDNTFLLHDFKIEDSFFSDIDLYTEAVQELWKQESMFTDDFENKGIVFGNMSAEKAYEALHVNQKMTRDQWQPIILLDTHKKIYSISYIPLLTSDEQICEPTIGFIYIVDDNNEYKVHSIYNFNSSDSEACLRTIEYICQLKNNVHYSQIYNDCWCYIVESIS